MSIVENLINQISSQGLGGITKPLGFDMEDDTFAKLLEKQMNANNEFSTPNSIGQMGAPAGFIIEPLDATDGVEHAEKVQDQMEILGQDFYKQTGPSNIEIKDMNFEDYFSNMIKASTNQNNDFMNFAKRQATNAYNFFNKGFIADVEDFVQDITAIS